MTQLLKPPRIVALERLHGDELVDDVEDRIWSLYGQIAHTILERANSLDLAEKRFAATFAGKVVSAQIDTLSFSHGFLRDWKFQTSWKFLANKPVDPDWIAQLNMQREIMLRQPEHKDLEINRLGIVGLLRDWSKVEARGNPTYPQKQVVDVDIPIWPREQTTSFIEMRVREMEETLGKTQSQLPLCSPSERWAKQEAWAVMRGEKAVKFGVCFSEAEAYVKLDTELQKKPGAFIQHRPGQNMRCEFYCSVSEYCTQFKSMKGAL